MGGRYEVLSLIGQGGMGAVYRAKDRVTGVVMALKQMTVEAQEHQDYYLDRFEQEARFLESLDHKAIPKVTDHLAEEGCHYLVMEFIEGPSLLEKLKSYQAANEAFPEKEVIHFAVQLCDVLDYLHARDEPVVHRDVKPENVIVREGSDQIVLVDFGIARGVDAGSTKTMVGTMGYAPLEQIRGHPEPRSDLYALGASMHHLLSGEPPQPFQLTPLGTVAPHVHPTLREVVERATQNKSAKRYLSAGQMKKALREALAAIDPSVALEMPSTAEVDSRREEFEQMVEQQSRQASYMVFSVVLVVGVLLAVVGIFFISSLREQMNAPGKPQPTSTTEFLHEIHPIPLPPTQGGSKGSVPQPEVAPINFNPTPHPPSRYAELAAWFTPASASDWVAVSSQNLQGGQLRAMPGQTAGVVLQSRQPVNAKEVSFRMIRDNHPSDVVIQIGEFNVQSFYDHSQKQYRTTLIGPGNTTSSALMGPAVNFGPLHRVSFQGGQATLSIEGEFNKVSLPSVSQKGLNVMAVILGPSRSLHTLMLQNLTVR